MAKPFKQGRFEDLPERPRIPHPYFEATREDVEVDSAPFGHIRVRLARYGAGPPLLLVHGLMTSSYSWRYVLEPLGQRFHLIMPDLPGCGESEAAPDRSHSAAELATFLRELQERLEITGCPAVGNSLGGYICMHLALRAPTSFSRLALVHPPALPTTQLRLLSIVMKLPGVPLALAWWIARDPERFAHRHVHYYDETLKSLEEARMYGGALSSRSGARSFTRMLADALHPAEMARFAGELARRRDAGECFPAPLLLVYARQDPIVPPRVGAKLRALLPEAGFEWLDRSSHFAQVDSPDRLAPLLTAFLAGVGH